MYLYEILGRVIAFLFSVILFFLSVFSLFTTLPKLKLYLLVGDYAGVFGYSLGSLLIFSLLFYGAYRSAKYSFKGEVSLKTSEKLLIQENKDSPEIVIKNNNLDGMSDQPWGFWVILKNESDAHWALKISGLLFFLMGASSLISIYFVGFKDQNTVMISSFLALLSVFLIWSGIRMRYKKYSLFIFSAAIFLCAQLIHFYVSPISLSLLGILQCILMLSAIRAWFYLRKTQIQVIDN